MNTVMTANPPLSPAAQALLDHIRANDWVTYAEIEDVLAPYITVEGDGGLVLPDFQNMVLWQGVSRAFAETVNEVLGTHLVCREPVRILLYLTDGKYLTLPLAKRLYDYATPHWLPVCFRPLERCEVQVLGSKTPRRRRK